MKQFACCISFVVLCCSALAQPVYHDPDYVEDLSNRVLVSYFQEYRSMEINLIPSSQIDSSGTEALRLTSASPLYSGALLQYKGISIYLAGNSPQSEEHRLTEGEQQSDIWRMGVLYKGFFLNLNAMQFKGFNDRNFSQHRFSANEPSSFARYADLSVNAFNVDVKYYPGHGQFAQGMPIWFGLRQKKSKFSLGYRAGYQFTELNNQGVSLFADSLALSQPAFGATASTHSAFNCSLGPSLYLVAGKHFFFYIDGWFGLEAAFSRWTFDSTDEERNRVQFAFPEMRSALGFQNSRWIAALHYAYTSQSSRGASFTQATNYHVFGVILGYRMFSHPRWAF